MDDLNVIADEAQVIAGGVAEAQLVFLGATVLAVGAASWLTPRLQRMGHRWSVRWMQVWLLVLGAMTPTFPLLYLWAQGFFPIMMVLLAAFVALHAVRLCPPGHGATRWCQRGPLSFAWGLWAPDCRISRKRVPRIRGPTCFPTTLQRNCRLGCCGDSTKLD